MNVYLPLLIVGALIGTLATIFILAYAFMKNKKEAIGFDRNMKDMDLIRRLARYAYPYRFKLLGLLVFVVFSILTNLISPLLMGKIEELVKDTFELPTLYLYVGGYVALLIFSLLSTYILSVSLQKIGQKIVSAIRLDTFVHIESLSHEQLNNIPVGKLVTRVTNDTGALSHLFTNMISNLVKNVFIIIGTLILMFTVNYAMTLMVLCFVPFIVLFTLIFRQFSRRAHREVKDATTELNTYLSENLSGIKITQIFGKEEEKMDQFEVRAKSLAKARVKQIFVFGIFRPVVYMLYIASVMFLFFFGAKGYIEDFTFAGQVVTSGVIVTFYMYIETIFGPIQQLAEQFNFLQGALASAEKIFTIQDMVPEVVDEEDAIELSEVRGEIEFRDVWFAYKEDEWVLRGVSFHILPKQTVAFVGATGSGKTTILSLICRNYNIQKGQILIDGIDIRKIKISSLRRLLGQMLQDVFLFSGTIRSNIVLDEEFTEEEIREACHYVNADAFIDKLPAGLDEVVRERGNNFSQGQRQLLSFARTVIHRPSVMILDEATANIDTETELLIQDSLEKMKNIGTMLVVAHRLSTIQHADNIILLSHGEILEEGTHAELLAKRGRYHELYMLQYEAEMSKEDEQ
ncbi:MAG: ABC transporter ATP-binding protein [Clostridia bacterium]|nr:ABC transporter ATP-binding protein [Clostridia bacterium]